MSDTKFKEFFEKAFEATCVHQKRFLNAREKARSEYRNNEREVDNRLRIHIDSLLTNLGDTLINSQIANSSQESSYQISLCASFTRCHFIVSDLLLEGNLVEAFTLVRRQLEGLARLQELDIVPAARIEGKTPHVTKATGTQNGALYGLLSEAAHFTKARVGELLGVGTDGDLIGPSPYPSFQKEAYAVFDRHAYVSLCFAQWFHETQKSWYPKIDFSLREELLARTYLVAFEAGVVKLPEGVEPPEGLEFLTSLQSGNVGDSSSGNMK